MPAEELETRVKLAIYSMTADTGRVPNASEIARKVELDEAEVLAAFRRLHAKRLLVPEPKEPTRIRMAPPFSGIETAFPVEALGKRYYANCVWDAFGIAAALHADAISHASDGYTGEPLTLEVKNNQPVPKPYVAHFAVPTAHWWDDIVFT
jgi:Alkylmercury lyase